METDKVLEFLQKIIDQLGEAGTQAFQIVAQRVFAEAVAGTVLGILTLVTIAVVAKKIWKIAAQHAENGGSYAQTDAEIAKAASAILAPVLSSVVILFVLYPSVVNLLSLEYATIERILYLVR
jgi:hypothetical protein